MHGKLLILAGLAVSGGIGAAAVVGIEPRIFLHVPPRVPPPYAGTRQMDAVAARLGLTSHSRCRPEGRASLQTRFRRGARCSQEAGETFATLLLAPDGHGRALRWTGRFSDSANAAFAQDSLAALLAPGRAQLACDVQQHPRYVLAVTLLAADSVLINFELRHEASGSGAYALHLQAERLEPFRVRLLCWRPLGLLPWAGRP